MRRFIRNTALFSILPLCLIVLAFFLADGTIDPFYLRFTTPKQASLILGTSRAAQGLQPHVIDSVLHQKGFNFSIFNYSFTLAHSPYGPVYYEAIRKKLDEATKGGVYIIAVDPWSVSSRTKDPNDFASFEENNLCLATTKDINSGHPNIEYLIHSYAKPIFSIYIDQIKNAVREPTTLLHKNGWLEVRVSMDPVAAKARLKTRIDEYRSNFAGYYHFSSLRFSYLEKTIDLLSKHGDVYLVRLPVDEGLRNMDDRLVPNFDVLMHDLSVRKKAPYLNYIEDSKKYTYSDGNHLYQSSGRQLSERIAHTIAKLKHKSEDQ
jgi:hypothetical protein